MNQIEKNQVRTAEAIENLDENQAAQAGCQAQPEAKPMQEYIKDLGDHTYCIIGVPRDKSAPDGYVELLPLEDSAQSPALPNSIKLVFCIDTVYFKLLRDPVETLLENMVIVDFSMITPIAEIQPLNEPHILQENTKQLLNFGIKDAMIARTADIAK